MGTASRPVAVVRGLVRDGPVVRWSGFGVGSFGFRVGGWGLGVSGLGFGVPRLRGRAGSSEFRVYAVGRAGLAFRVGSSAFTRFGRAGLAFRVGSSAFTRFGRVRAAGRVNAELRTQAPATKVTAARNVSLPGGGDRPRAGGGARPVPGRSGNIGTGALGKTLRHLGGFGAAAGGDRPRAGAGYGRAQRVPTEIERRPGLASGPGRVGRAILLAIGRPTRKSLRFIARTHSRGRWRCRLCRR